MRVGLGIEGLVGCLLRFVGWVGCALLWWKWKMRRRNIDPDKHTDSSSSILGGCKSTRKDGMLMSFYYPDP